MRKCNSKRIRIQNSFDGITEFQVNTLGGVITAKSVGDTDYPDISIFIKDKCIGFVEWNSYSKQFNFYYFGTNEDTPKVIFENITEI